MVFSRSTATPQLLIERSMLPGIYMVQCTTQSPVNFQIDPLNLFSGPIDQNFTKQLKKLGLFL